MKSVVDTPCPSTLPVLLTAAEPRPLKHGRCFVEFSTPPREASGGSPVAFLALFFGRPCLDQTLIKREHPLRSARHGEFGYCLGDARLQPFLHLRIERGDPA